MDSGFLFSVLTVVESDACTSSLYVYMPGQRSGVSDLPFIKLVLQDGLPDSHVASPDRSPENRKMFRHFEVRLRALC
jgi:hypothetical protein